MTMKSHVKYKPTTLRKASEMTAADPDPKGWKLHLFNFVDDFRRQPGIGLVEEALSPRLDRHLAALFASTAWALCEEKGISTPLWISELPPLDEPWFVSGFKSLRAMTLRDCPVYFRQKNVWVMKDFLFRV